MPQRKYDEERELHSPWEWVIITLFSASIMGFGLLVYHLVDDGPRYWDLGQLADTPAESIYSTDKPQPNVGIPQTPPLPGAKRFVPPQPPKPEGAQLGEREQKR
jgi:hypothetical protein